MPERSAEYTMPERLGKSFTVVREIDIKETLRILGRRKRVIGATVVVLTTLVAAAVFLITPRYTAYAEIGLDAQSTNMIDFEAAFAGVPQDSAALLTEIEVIRSRKLADRVVDKLGLDLVPEFNSSLTQESYIKAFLGGFAEEWLPDWGGDDGPATESRFARGSTEDQIEYAERKRVIDALQERVGVAQDGGSRVVVVSVTSEDPFAAAAIANALAELYLVERLENRFENARRASNWLAERVQELREEVEVSEKLVEQYRKKHSLLEGAQTSLLTEQISELNVQLSEAKIQRAEAEANYAQARRLLRSRTGGLSSAIQVLESDLIQYYREQEADLERREAELSQQYGPRHPLMINLRAEKERFRKTIELEVQKIAEGLRNGAEIARLRVASIEKNLEALKTDMTTANEAGVQLNSLERDAEANRVLLERFQVAFMEANAQQDADSQMPGARIISPATIPEKPSFPKATLFIAAGFAGSILIGVLLAFGVEALDGGFRSGEQVEQQLGVPVISLIPLLGRVRLAGEKPETYVLKKPDSSFGEAVRSIHTSMMLASAGHSLRTIAVCSSEAGEGKTTVAISLAQLQARLGRRVLIVDSDFRRPSVAKSLGLRQGPGLMEFMAGTASHTNIVQRHPESGTDVIVSGDYTEAGYDLIASEKTENLIKRWRETYDLVVIDTAPLQVVSDSRIFTKYADGTFLVVRWGKTRREVVNYSLNMISEAGGRLFGVVLSMVDTKSHATYGFGDSGVYYGKAKKYYRE